MEVAYEAAATAPMGCSHQPRLESWGQRTRVTQVQKSSRLLLSLPTELHSGGAQGKGQRSRPEEDQRRHSMPLCGKRNSLLLGIKRLTGFYFRELLSLPEEQEGLEKPLVTLSSLTRQEALQPCGGSI